MFKRDVFWVGLLAVLLLAVYSPRANPLRLHVDGFKSYLNDQVFYTTIARNFAERGVLESNMIYPAFFAEETSKNHPYLPGYPLVLACSYRLFGFGDFQSVLPSMMSFILSAVMVFLIGRHFYGRRAAWVSAVLFVVFPVNVVFAYTAMMESTFVASCLVAFYLFLKIPPRRRPYLGPLILLIPGFVRETSIMLAIPMVFMIFRGSEKGRWRSCLLFLTLVLSLTAVVLVSDAGSGRPSLWAGRIMDISIARLISDATVGGFDSRPLTQWVPEIAANFLGNIHMILAWTESRFGFTSWAVLLILILCLLGLFPMRTQSEKDMFSFASGCAGLLTFFFLCAVYNMEGLLAIRVVLYIFPFVLIPFVGKVMGWVRRLGLKFLNVIAVGCLVFTAMVGTCWTFVATSWVSRWDPWSDQSTDFVEKLNHNDESLLVAPVFAMDYAYRHYPVRWSFIPANMETLRLLARKYQIGTMILPLRVWHYRKFAEEIQSTTGLIPRRSVQYNGQMFVIFRDVNDKL